MSHKYYAPKKYTAADTAALIAKSKQLQIELQAELDRMKLLIEQRRQL